jgi:hypothetical protein
LTGTAFSRTDYHPLQMVATNVKNSVMVPISVVERGSLKMRNSVN